MLFRSGRGKQACENRDNRERGRGVVTRSAGDSGGVLPVFGMVMSVSE